MTGGIQITVQQPRILGQRKYLTLHQSVHNNLFTVVAAHVPCSVWEGDVVSKVVNASKRNGNNKISI